MCFHPSFGTHPVQDFWHTLLPCCHVAQIERFKCWHAEKFLIICNHESQNQCTSARGSHTSTHPVLFDVNLLFRDHSWQIIAWDWAILLFIATLNDVIFHFISLLSLFDFPIFPHFEELGKCKSKNTLHKVQQQLALASNNFFLYSFTVLLFTVQETKWQLNEFNISLLFHMGIKSQT